MFGTCFANTIYLSFKVQIKQDQCALVQALTKIFELIVPLFLFSCHFTVDTFYFKYFFLVILQSLYFAFQNIYGLDISFPSILHSIQNVFCEFYFPSKFTYIPFILGTFQEFIVQLLLFPVIYSLPQLNIIYKKKKKLTFYFSQ